MTLVTEKHLLEKSVGRANFLLAIRVQSVKYWFSFLCAKKNSCENAAVINRSNSLPEHFDEINVELTSKVQVGC